MLTKSIASRTLALAAAALFSKVGVSAPITSPILTPAGTLQTVRHDVLGMSASGRYVLLQDSTPGRMTVRDMKTQVTSVLPVALAFASGHYAISPNGRYISYTRPVSGPLPRGMVFDQVTQTFVDILVRDESRWLSDTGLVASRDQVNSGGLILFDSKNLTTKVISTISGAGWASPELRNSMSSDGRIILYYAANGYHIHDGTSGQSYLFQPLRSGSVPLDIQTWGSPIALSSSGKYVAFKSNDVNDTGNRHLYRANLLPAGAHTLDRFDLGAKFVTVEDGLSVSANGRFISFRGQLKAGHPEFAAAQAAGLIPPYRVFRYDALYDQLTTASQAYNNSPLMGANPDIASASVAPTSQISNDGSIVSFATNAINLIPNQGSSQQIQNYHAHLGNGFARNYQYIDMPNTDNGWKPFAPMTLVGNNQWEGRLTFDGVGAESFKFDVGGTLVDGKYSATPHWAINFGSGNTANLAVANGGNIPIPSAGTYDITFNDQTRAYTVNPVSEFRLQHVGGLCVHARGDAAYAANGTPVTLGASCLNQAQRRFRLLANKSLQQVSSGMCLHPEGGSISPNIGTRLVVWNQCDDGPGNKKLAFEFTGGGSLRHVNSGLCVHPRGGSATPAVDTELLLWNSCDEPRLGIGKL